MVTRWTMIHDSLKFLLFVHSAVISISIYLILTKMCHTCFHLKYLFVQKETIYFIVEKCGSRKSSINDIYQDIDIK